MICRVFPQSKPNSTFFLFIKEIFGSPISPPQTYYSHSSSGLANKENLGSKSQRVSAQKVAVYEDTEFELRSSLASYTPSNSPPKNKLKKYCDADDSDSSTNLSSPPVTLPASSASKKDISNFYWEMCYGPGSCTKSLPGPKLDGSWSAKRAPPAKSWYVIHYIKKITIDLPIYISYRTTI